MSRRRKAGAPKSRPPRKKESDRKRRRCSSGKIGWRHKGEADAALRKRKPLTGVTTYECSECGKWHFGNTVTRSVRRRLAEEGKPIPPPREDS